MITEKDPDEKAITYLQNHFDVDPLLFKQDYVYKTIQESINKAIKRARNKEKESPAFTELI